MQKRNTRREAIRLAIGAAAASSLLRFSAEAATAKLDIVDGQIHVGRGGIAPALALMNDLGITSAIIYEYWGSAEGDPRRTLPGFRLPNDAWRSVDAVASEASLAYPDRFASVIKVDRNDPQLRAVLEVIASTPHIKGIRVQPLRSEADTAAFANGVYGEFFAMAQDLAIPIIIFVPGKVALLAPYLRRFPRLTMMIDHCGMPFPPRGQAETASGIQWQPALAEVLKLAQYPGAALKWSHATNLFGKENAEFAALRPILRQVITAYSPERVMWASDYTMAGRSWSALLQAILGDDGLSAAERQWVLGGTARKLLDWPRLST
jgi:L-fuconolactonase